MVPDRVCVPPLMVSAPEAPDRTPEKSVEPLVMVRVLPVMMPAPAPDKVTIDAPEVVALISKAPAIATSLDELIEPEPDRAKVAPDIVVVPV